MPLFVFKIIEGKNAREPETVELPDLNAARRLATNFLGDVVKEGDGLVFDQPIELQVTDEGGLVLLMINVLATEPPEVRT